jgi:tRNA pseudouridine55 synthase
LNLNKPAGMTSRQVVDIVQRLVRPLKAGHAGTLDPLATGVLVICVGKATRLIQYLQQMPKGYTGTFLLGRTSPTEDVEGEVAELSGPPVPSREQIVAAAQGFRGQIQQRPPAFSALKVAGRRAYDLARQGKQVELQARPVTIYALDVVRYDYPELVLRIECSGGTYVRSLGRDLAESLGTAAVMSALVRTAVGPLALQEAIDPRELTGENWHKHLLPMTHAVQSLPRVELTAEDLARVRNGLAVRDPRQCSDAWQSWGDEIAALDPQGELVAILGPRGQGWLGPVRNFL